LDVIQLDYTKLIYKLVQHILVFPKNGIS